MPKISEDVKPLVELANKHQGTGINAGRGPFRLAEGGKHMKLIDKQGRRVMDKEGKPIIVSGSPGEHRNRALMVNRWLGAGVIPRDPFKPTKPGEEVDEDTRTQREKEKEDRREARVNEQRAQSERTQEIRSRLLPYLMRLGGIDTLADELGTVIFHFARKRQLSAGVRWRDEDMAAQSVRQIRTGGTLSSWGAEAWDAFTHELEEAERNDISLVTRYTELMREIQMDSMPVERDLNIAERRISGPLPDLTTAAEPVREHRLTWHVLYEMARGQGGTKAERDRVMYLALLVRRLEDEAGDVIADALDRRPINGEETQA